MYLISLAAQPFKIWRFLCAWGLYGRDSSGIRFHCMHEKGNWNTNFLNPWAHAVILSIHRPIFPWIEAHNTHNPSRCLVSWSSTKSVSLEVHQLAPITIVGVGTNEWPMLMFSAHFESMVVHRCLWKGTWCPFLTLVRVNVEHSTANFTCSSWSYVDIKCGGSGSRGLTRRH